MKKLNKSSSDISALFLSLLWLSTLNFSKITPLQYIGIAITIVLFTLIIVKNILIYKSGIN